MGYLRRLRRGRRGVRWISRECFADLLVGVGEVHFGQPVPEGGIVVELPEQFGVGGDQAGNGLLQSRLVLYLRVLRVGVSITAPWNAWSAATIAGRSSAMAEMILSLSFW